MKFEFTNQKQFLAKIRKMAKESNISWKPSYFYNLDSSSEVEKKFYQMLGQMF